MLDHKILVGTHHKTGTVWMRKVFKKVANNSDLKFFSGLQDNLPEQYDIFCQDHSRFTLESFSSYRGMHLIRDPRDIIVSGCFYHQKSEEKWLHSKKKRFSGLTYQEKLNSYESLDDKILFEMDNFGQNVIGDMKAWNYDNNSFIEVKYEKLIIDYDLELFRKIFTFLGFSEQSIPQLLNIAHENSLFSGNIKQSVHVRSGKSSQWVKYFKPHHKKRFIELYGDVLIYLGYEQNHDWSSCSV
jgi:hypothetical protein